MALSDDSMTPDELNALLAAREAASGTPAKLALLFGTEGEGLSPATTARCDHTVRIPMAHGVDSLNVAASSARGLLRLPAAEPAGEVGNNDISRSPFHVLCSR